MQIQLQLIENTSNATHFTFYSENSGEIILQTDLLLNDVTIVNVEDTITNFRIEHNGNNDDFNFISSSII